MDNGKSTIHKAFIAYLKDKIDLADLYSIVIYKGRGNKTSTYMLPISLTYQGVIITLIGFMFKAAGVPFVEGDIENFVSVGVALLGAVLTLWGRYRLGGLNFFGLRKGDK